MKANLAPAERDAIIHQFDELARTAPFNILTRETLKQLATLSSDGAPIISLYLDLGPQARLNGAWATVLKSLSREALAKASGDFSDWDIVDEFNRIEKSIEAEIPQLGRGVAYFVCNGLGLWYRIALPLSLPNRLSIDRRAHLRPLLRMQDEHDRFAVAMLDKRRARLFISQLGQLHEVADLFEDTPPRHKQGGWSQMRFQRHHEAHVLWHAGAVAHATSLLMERFEARHCWHPAVARF